MDSGNLESNLSKIADGFADEGFAGERFYFSSLQQREVIATLRYGIEARKGLIVCTGDAGTGKSMLLRKLERELGPDIGCLVIADPYLSFGEIVRRLLRSLHAPSESASELVALERCRELLRAQLATGRITALAFDDAHHLRDELLEKLLQNMIGGDGERDRNLAQVVLIGRPELKERLFQPPLRSVGSLVAVECRLQPLNEQEIVDYIRQRLRAADLPEELFEHEALARIADYSGGNFRQANALCERAIRTAQSSARSQISSEIVDGAAKDLDLRQQPRWMRKENAKTSAAPAPPPFTAPQNPPIPPRNRRPLPPDPPQEPFRFPLADDDSTAAAGTTDWDFSRTHDHRQLRRRRGKGLVIASLIIVGLAVIAGVWLHSDTARQAVGALGGKLEDLATSGKTSAPEMETTRVPPYEPPREPLNSSPPPQGSPSTSPDDSQTTPTPPQIFDKPELPPASPAPETLPENPPVEEKKAAPPRMPAKVPPAAPMKPRYDLETEVFKALQNRAIEGVHVSISDNIVSLDGQVATERQRRAAETAAQGVPGVRAVRNRITVQ